MTAVNAEQAREILEELRAAPTAMDDTLAALEIDSLLLVEWVFELEERLGREISQDVFELTWNECTVRGAIERMLESI